VTWTVFHVTSTSRKRGRLGTLRCGPTSLSSYTLNVTFETYSRLENSNYTDKLYLSRICSFQILKCTPLIANLIFKNKWVGQESVNWESRPLMKPFYQAGLTADDDDDDDVCEGQLVKWELARKGEVLGGMCPSVTLPTTNSTEPGLPGRDDSYNHPRHAGPTSVLIKNMSIILLFCKTQENSRNFSFWNKI
jgi:hypothetical protein